VLLLGAYVSVVFHLARKSPAKAEVTASPNVPRAPEGTEPGRA
jgi:hypothetical protein